MFERELTLLTDLLTNPVLMAWCAVGALAAVGLINVCLAVRKVAVLIRERRAGRVLDLRTALLDPHFGRPSAARVWDECAHRSANR